MKNKISQILSLLNNGNIDQGLQHSKDLFREFPNNVDVIKLLVYAYILVGNFEKAALILEQSLRLKVNVEQDFDYNNNLGYALVQSEEYERAISYLEKAITIKSDFPGVYANIALIYQKRRDFITSKKYIDNAIKIVTLLGKNEYSKYANIFLLFSEINSALKKDDETIKIFLEILGQSFNADIFYILSNIQAESLPYNLIDETENKIETNVHFQNKIEKFNFITPIYFGLANYYQKKDKNKSEDNFVKGNSEIFKFSRYNSHDYQQRILKSIEAYKKTFSNFNEIEDEAGSNNIFIVGSPRSGTTLIESIITANSRVFSAGELNSSKNLIERHINSASKDLYEFKYNYQAKYLARTNFLRGDHTYIVDKMPENFLFIGQMLKLLPKSKIILTLRDPWDTAISLFKQRYVLNVPYSASFFNIGIFLANFEAIIVFWMKNIQNKSHFMTIKYEEVVSDQKQSQKKLYDFLDIQIGDFDENRRKDFFSPTASIRQVTSNIHQNSLKKGEFMEYKKEFYDSLEMQKKFWISKGILTKNDDFFGYL